MSKSRIPRLNSLLKQVISEVIQKNVRNPEISDFISVTAVNISADLRHAKVLISVIGPELEKQKTIEALNSAAGFIAVHASKKVILKYFPSLTFKLDQTVEHQARIEEVLNQIHQEKKTRSNE